ncbi:zona pellucida sperm-binding protein 4-like [Pempheris klunzingeri]|uniref:zona pellucida sperm-binding protein 4-like n=1 Tax=Pempheris klunzingeri TaxID=3127111 RepID=UPI00397F7742
MAMKLISGCLLAVALLGCLADAQYSKNPQQPQQPQQPQAPKYPAPPPPPPQQPQAPQAPKYQPPPPPQQPQAPQAPKYHPPPPQQPQAPQAPKYHPPPPQQPQAPQAPKYHPPPPQQPQAPQAPKYQPPPPPQQPQAPQAPKYQPAPPPQQPQAPQAPKYQPAPPPKQPQAPQVPRYQPAPPPKQPQAPQAPKYQPLAPPKQPQAPRYQPQYQQQPDTKVPAQPTETFHTCEVDQNYKIQCGAPTISASDCEAINCCFDGRMCHYGKSVTLQCTKDAQFIIVVARDATLPNIDLETISFNGADQNCSPVGTTSVFAIYQFPVTACGTVMMEEPGVIIYENRMSSFYEVSVGPLGAITRDSHYELIVQCRYIGTTVEALVIEVGKVPPPIPVAAPGPLRVELRLGSGLCSSKGCVEEDVAYTTFYTDADYPVTKVLRDPVYVEVRMLERTDPNLVLTLGRCWATSSPYPHSLPQWDLLIDGCPYRDDRYLTQLVSVDASSGLLYPTHHRRFVFKMFTFVATGDQSTSKKGAAAPEAMTPLKEKVYIHCDATVCQPSAGDNCEPRCYRKRRDIAAADQKDLREVATLVSSPEILILQSSPSTQIEP